MRSRFSKGVGYVDMYLSEAAVSYLPSAARGSSATVWVMYLSQQRPEQKTVTCCALHSGFSLMVQLNVVCLNNSDAVILITWTSDYYCFV